VKPDAACRHDFDICFRISRRRRQRWPYSPLATAFISSIRHAAAASFRCRRLMPDAD